MSVPKSKRSLSELEFYHNAYVLRKSITELLLKDFGIRDKQRNIRAYVSMKRFDANDREEFLRLCDKYKINDNLIESYPTWLLDHFRTSLMDSMNSLINNITYANSVLASGASYLIDIAPNGNICFGGAADGTFQICTKRNGVITWHP